MSLIEVTISKNNETLAEIREPAEETDLKNLLLTLRSTKMKTNELLTNLVESDKLNAQQPQTPLVTATKKLNADNDEEINDDEESS